MGEIFVHESPRPTMPNTGERLTAGHLLETELEHYHRYYLARHFARGKAVLDVASGEGYGAAMLAQVAFSVQGVDISATAVAHASASYPAANLRFLQGDACRLPLADGCVDMVTSFETIEHVADHAAFLAEIRRVLRPDGVLLLSTPDRDVYSPPQSGANPHHVHELTKDEFHDLCAASFRHVALLTQTTLIGSVVSADRPPAATAPRLIFERRGATHVEATSGSLRSKYCLCLASDAALPDTGDSLLVHGTTLTGLGGEPGQVAALQSELDQRTREVAGLREQLGRREAFVGQGMAVFSDLHGKTLESHERERERHAQELAQRDAALALLRDAAMRQGQELAQRDVALAHLHEAASRYAQDLAQRDAAVARLREAATHDAHELARRDAALAQWRYARGATPAQASLMRVWARAWEGTAALLDRLARHTEVPTIRASPLFRAQWYRATYPDVASSGLSPARHYFRFGAAEGRDPGPDFSTSGYLQAYADVRQAGANPLVHFERIGRAEGREIVAPVPSGLADDQAPPPRQWKVVYVSGGPATPEQLPRMRRLTDAAAGALVTSIDLDALQADPDALAGCDVLVVWRAPWSRSLADAVAAARSRGAVILYDVDDGMFEPELAGADVIDGVRSVRSSPLFQADWYLDTYPDVGRSGLDPARHYFHFGAAEGRDPGPDFSTAGYLLANPDVRKAGVNALLHFELVGRAEAREIVTPRGSDLAKPAGAGKIHKTKVVYVSGEPDTSGHVYRVERLGQAAAAAGAAVTVLYLDSLATHHAALAACDLLVIWRAPWSDGLAVAVAVAREAGARILFDVDDLMFEPELATIDIIDGIRSQGFDAAATGAFFGRIAETLGAADATLAPTRYLAGRMQRHGKPAFVIPNGFDEAAWRAARQAVRRRRTHPGDGLLRIGYPAGSRTHQKDFAVAAEALADLLRSRGDARLVLFRKGLTTCIELDEFPALQALEQQVEWRELVPLAELPAEMARFDITLAPLQAGNPFCEAKSELKFFESALVGVPLIASPTAAFAEAIEHGRTGLIAADDAWPEALRRLADDPELRAGMGADAYRSVLWPYGPDRRTVHMRATIAQMTGDAAESADAFALDLHRRAGVRIPPPPLPPHLVDILQDRQLDARVSVVIPLYNYGRYIIEALQSVAAQTLDPLDLIVVDDASTDDGAGLARAWMLAHRGRFGRLVLVRNEVNEGLGAARNVGFAQAETPYVVQLDADNRLRPEFARRCLAEADATGAAFVYAEIQHFGSSDAVIGRLPYLAPLLAAGNYIDAMALVRVSCWAGVGGYLTLRMGWEDYDLWCRFAEQGMFGSHIPEVLSEYRVHAGSMLHTVTDIQENKRALVASLRARHPWVLDGVAGD